MNETIFLLNSNGQLVEMNEASYLSEDLLQKLLADYPSLISGSQINPSRPRRWLLISREFGIPDDNDSAQRWSLDHLFIDQDGIPTLVEVKRSSDTRIRREVIGQILDYAANAVSYWSIEEIKFRFEEFCKMTNQEPEVTIDVFLQNEIDAESFWEMTKTNLKAGKIRMLVIADTIPKEMQRIIEFLNEQMSPAEILGVEIKQFIGQELKTLVPRVIGMTSNAQTVKGKQNIIKDHWTRETLLVEILKQRGQKEAEVAEQILNWVEPKVNSFYYGVGKKMGSVAPILTTNNINRFCFAIWTYGTIEIYFQHMKGRPPFESEVRRLELLEKLNTIKGVSLPRDKVSARPGLLLSALIDNAELKKFLDAFNWYWKETELYLEQGNPK